MQGGGVFAACMQQEAAMEPDSSTDTQEQEQEQELEGEAEEGDRMQRLLQEHARLFSVKTEPEGAASAGGPPAAKRLKTYQSAQEELSELMKLTNEKLFKNTSSALPLSVEIDTEQDSSSDSVSPPRNPFTVTAHHAAAAAGAALSPRKRGRKPKHYSEILYELGQRGISITKTGAGRQQGGGGCGGPAPGHVPAAAAHTPGEMVVSENGSVSHKASGQQLKCPHCNKILTTSVGLMYHIRLHTGGYCNAHIISKVTQINHF